MCAAPSYGSEPQPAAAMAAASAAAASDPPPGDSLKRIKLIDFSLSSFFHSPTEPGGTPEFVAPELLSRPEQYAAAGCDGSVDMWAAGVTLFYLLSGRTPFEDPDVDQILEKVRSCRWGFKGKRWAKVSVEARDLVARLLQQEPSKRLSAAAALQHPWLATTTAAAARQKGEQLSEAIADFKVRRPRA